MKDAQPRMEDLSFAPDEDPFVVTHGGFYRRWLAMIEDLAALQGTVSRLTGTTDDVWVPAWREVGLHYENEGDRLEAAGQLEAARRAHLQAKTYYAIARFPTTSTPLKEEAHRDCVRTYLKACTHLNPPLEVVEVECEGRRMVAHYRSPSVASPDTPVPATLIMCGGDVFKEDRGWAGAFALEHGLASLVMDAPGTGENPFPHAPESVKAWMAAIDWLAARPEVDRARVGAFGISRGGYSVMLLAGSYPRMVKAAVAVAGNHFGYRMSPEETAAVVDMKNKRSTYVYGAPGDGPTFPRSSPEQEEADFRRWSLTELGVIDAITCPVLMVNGKRDHLAPIGNIYFMLESGPVTGKEARVYPDDGHCAFKHFDEWGNASFRWLAEKLAHPMVRY